MPDFPITPFTSSADISMSFIAFDGTERRVQIKNPPTAVTATQIDTMAQALGELSTMGLYQWLGAGERHRIAKPDATALDELYGPGVTLYLNFVNSADPDDTKTVSVPAPDAAYITGIRLNDPAGSADIQAAVDAVLVVLNAGGATYIFDGGQTDADIAPRRSVPGANEPASGQEQEGPGDNPIT